MEIHAGMGVHLSAGVSLCRVHVCACMSRIRINLGCISQMSFILFLTQGL